ncbi:9159_t:CDS:2, partial [Funneliformis caledonium]
DWNKIVKMLKILINNIAISYPDNTFYVYSMSMPFIATYYYKFEYTFTCLKTMRMLYKELLKFAYNLWKVRDLVKSSVSNIISYIDGRDSEASDISIDPVKQSPKKSRAGKS